MDPILNARALPAAVIACILLGSGCESAGLQRAAAPVDTPGSPAGVSYRLDAAASELHVLVYRAGPFARLGHNHVVSARELAGRLAVTPELTGSTFELALPVEQLDVDSPRWRAHFGEEFASTPSQADIDSTRANMLGATLLNAAAYPFVRVAGRISGASTAYSAEVEIAIKETVVRRTTPVALAFTGDTMTARGSLTIDHAELGLTPFSVLLGALRVAEALDFRFELVATRVSSEGPD